jgi:hypothetical protein
MSLIKILIQLLTGFGLLYLGLKLGHEYRWSIGNYAMYWLFYAIINIAVVIWRMTEPHYDAKADVKQAFKIAKKCPHCMKKLPSYFSSKCPHCTADL